MKEWWQRPVWIFDQGRTFLFENDRFAVDQPYFETYRRLGGAALSEARVNGLIDTLHCHMAALYRDIEGADRFPGVAAALEELGVSPKLEADEAALLIKVFGEHECGTIPPDHIDFLKRCARTKRIGLLSNIWAPCECFERAHREHGIAEVFEHRIWSSSFGAIKPSPRIFAEALRCFGVGPHEAVYIGDNHARDVVPAKALGWAAVWVNPDKQPVSVGGPAPDAEVRSLPELTQYLDC